jgi:hypothetical protein
VELVAIIVSSSGIFRMKRRAVFGLAGRPRQLSLFESTELGRSIYEFSPVGRLSGKCKPHTSPQVPLGPPMSGLRVILAQLGK